MTNDSVAFRNGLRNAKKQQLDDTGDVRDNISQISKEVGENIREINKLKKDFIKISDHNRAWLGIKIAATITIMIFLFNFNNRIDKMYQILINQSQEPEHIQNYSEPSEPSTSESN